MSKIIHTRIHRRPAFARLTVSAIAIAAAMPAIAQETIIVGDGEVITDTVNLPNDGDSLTVDQGGTISTDAIDGVNAGGDDVIIDNAGTITTIGDDAEGIFASGVNVAISNSGLISSDGEDASAIRITGDNAIVTNTGTLRANGFDADAITIEANGARFENAGLLSTTAEEGEGASLDGNDIVFVNTGLITTIGETAEGIDVGGENVRIENSGDIITTGEGGDGVEFDRANGTLINSGLIQTSGVNADGVELDSINGVIENSGRILTAGEMADGIRLEESGGRALNTGTVQTLGAEAIGVLLDDETSFVNQGNILTQGALSNGVEMRGSDSIFNNSGLISATGENALAILGSEDTQTVTLDAGSQIIGAIDLGGGEDTLNVGLIGSAVMEIAGVEALNVSDRLGVIDLGDRQVFIETTGLAALEGVTDAVALNIHRSIDTQITTAGTGPWASILGEAGESEGSDDQLGVSHDFAGIMAGFDTAIGATRLGFVGGVTNGNVTTDEQSYDIESERAFGGAYVMMPTAIADITGSILFGAEAHDSTRFVFDSTAGQQDATADIDGRFISAGLTARGASFDLGGLSLRPVGSATFTQTQFDSYTEEGAGDTNLSFDERTAQSLHLRGQLEADYMLGAVQTTLRTGLDAGYTQADDVSGRLDDAEFSVAAFNDDETVLGGFAGVRAVLLGTDQVSVTGDAEYRFADDDTDAIAAGLNVSFRF